MNRLIVTCLSSVACCLAANAATTGQLSATPVAGPYRPHVVRLQSFVVPAAGAVGLTLQARVDGGPPLRLLLDTGAEYLVLDRKAAARSGHTEGTAMNIVGMDGPAKAAFLTKAVTVGVNELVMLRSPLLIVNGKVLDGIDGVIPLSLFADFLVHLDVRSKTLQLEPFSAGNTEGDEGFVKAKSHRNLLFLKTRLADSTSGYLLLDTGSSNNIISAGAVEKLPCYRARVSVCDQSVAFRVGAHTMTLEPAIAVDLREMSKRHDLEVAGVIGYPALSECTITVDYRNALVRIVKSPTRRERRLEAQQVVPRAPPIEISYDWRRDPFCAIQINSGSGCPASLNPILRNSQESQPPQGWPSEDGS